MPVRAAVFGAARTTCPKTKVARGKAQHAQYRTPRLVANDWDLNDILTALGQYQL